MKTKQKTKTENITVSALLGFLVFLLKQENLTVKTEFEKKTAAYKEINIPFKEKPKYITSLQLTNFIALASEKFNLNAKEIEKIITENWKQFETYLSKTYEEIFDEVEITNNFYKDLKQYLILLKAYGKTVVSCRQVYKMLNVNSYHDVNDIELTGEGIKTVWVYKSPYYALTNG